MGVCTIQVFWFVALVLGWLCGAGVLGLNGLVSGFEFRF